MLVVLGVTGCTGTPAVQPSPASAPPSAAATDTSASDSGPVASPTPTAVVLVPNGTASQNLAFFTSVVDTVWAGPDQVAGRAYVDALVSAGFDKAAMQVTSDQSTIGNAAESIEFSVRVGDQCLVGQVGPSIGGPVTAVMPGLSAGGCLIGQTRAIDW